MKQCVKCKETKPLFQFKKQKKATDGRYKICIKCIYGYEEELNTETDKRCTKCKEIKSLELFPWSDRRLNIRKAKCKECDSVDRAKRGYCKTPEQNRRHSLKHLYGITPEQYNEMLKDQDNKCKICKTEKYLVID